MNVQWGGVKLYINPVKIFSLILRQVGSGMVEEIRVPQENYHYLTSECQTFMLGSTQVEFKTRRLKHQFIRTCFKLLDH